MFVNRELKSIQYGFSDTLDLVQPRLHTDSLPRSNSLLLTIMPHVLSPADLAKKAERLAKKQAAQAAKLAAAAQDPSSSSSSSAFEVSSPAGSAGILKRNWVDLDEVEAGEGERRVKVATWNMLAQTLVRKSTNLCAHLVLSFIDHHVSHDLFYLIHSRLRPRKFDLVITQPVYGPRVQEESCSQVPIVSR